MKQVTQFIPATLRAASVASHSAEAMKRLLDAK